MAHAIHPDDADSETALEADGRSAAAIGRADDNEGVLAGLTHFVEKVDELAGDEDNPANRLGGDGSRYLPWIGVLLAVASILLVPWIVYIAFTLPSRALSPNYDIAWAGFDVLLLLSLVATAVTVLRRSRWTATAAGATAGLLVTDAWFDIVTSQAGEARIEAIVLAALVELPMAGLCAWTARHSTEITEHRMEILLRLRRRRAAGSTREP